MKKPIAILEIPFLADSLNKYYAMHFMVKNKQKNKCEEIVTKYIESNPLDLSQYKNFELEFNFNLTSKQRAYDIINYAATIKLIEDRLVHLKIFKNDDNMNIIKHTINKPTKVKDLKECITIVKIFGEKNEW